VEGELWELRRGGSNGNGWSGVVGHCESDTYAFTNRGSRPSVRIVVDLEGVLKCH